MKYLFFIFLFLIIIQLQAQPGTLDQSFGVSGVALGIYNSNYNSGFGVAQQSDGKILNAGTISQASPDDFYMLRYLSDGTIDTTFGNNGSVSGPIGNGDDQAFDIIQQADSKILLVGAYDNNIERDVFIRRYDSTGTLDAGFGNGGMVSTDFQNGSDDIALRVRIQPDGKILVCGSSADNLNNTSSIILLRYNSNGTLDSTFGNGGKVSFGQLMGDQFASQFALQTSGKIVVVGATDDVNGLSDILVLRFLSDGSLDNSFNVDGIFTFDLLGDDEEGWALALQPDGKILVGGLGSTINGEDDLLLRLDSTGNLDPSFNSTGILTKDHNQSLDYITSILIQADGKIITIGQSYNLKEKISLSRYLSTGADDNVFGNGGSFLYSLGNDDCNSNSAILQADNRIVITGSIETTTTSDNFIARFNNDSLPVSLNDLNVFEKRLYPIPAIDKIHLKDFKPGTLTIYDSRGQIVYSCHMESNSLDVSFLSSGIYLLRIDSAREQFIQKFIKQ